MYCSKCGKEIPASAAFCPYCGAKTSEEAANDSGDDQGKHKRGKKVWIALAVLALLVVAAAIAAFVVLDKKDAGYEMNVIDEETGEYLLVDVPENFSMDISVDEGSSQKKEPPAVFDIYSKRIETNNKIKDNTLTIEAPKGGYEKGEAYTIDITGYGTFTDEKLSKAKKLLFVIKEKNTSSIEYKENVEELPAGSVQVEGKKITVNGQYETGQIILTDSDGDGIEEIYKLTNASSKGDKTEAGYTEPEADEVYEDIDIFYYGTIDPKELEIDEEAFKGELETSGILEAFCDKAYADSDIKFKVDKKTDGTYCDFTIKLSDPADETRQLIFKAKVANKILYKNKNGLVLMNNSLIIKDGIEISVKGEKKKDAERAIKREIKKYTGGNKEEGAPSPEELKIPLMPVKIPLIGPVYAKFELGIIDEISIGGSFHVGADLTATLTSGVLYNYKNNKIVKKYTGFEPDINAYVMVKGTIKAFAGGYVEAGVVVPFLVTVEVDPKVGTAFDAEGCAIINNIPKKPSLEGYYSLEIAAKIKVDLKIQLLKEFTHKINMFDSKRPIWKKSNKLQFRSLDLQDSYTIENDTIDLGDIVVTYYDVIEGKEEESNLAEYELYIDGDAKNVTEGKVSFEKGPGEYDFKFVWEKDKIKFEQSKKVIIVKSPLDYFADINQVGNSYSDVNSKYDLHECNSTDWFKLLESSSKKYRFVFNPLSVEGRQEYDLLPDDKCSRMSGKASDMLGIVKPVYVSWLEEAIGTTLEAGQGDDLDNSSDKGLIGTINIPDETESYSILIKDVSVEGLIKPETEIYIGTQKAKESGLFDESIWICRRGQTLGTQSLLKFHSDGTFSEYFLGSETLSENAGTWEYHRDTSTLHLFDNASYTGGQEEVFIEDGDAFRSENPVEMMSGSDYQWIAPDSGHEDLF